MVDGINFNGGVTGPNKGGKVKQQDSAVLPNIGAVWGGVKFYAPSNSVKSSGVEASISSMSNRMSPVVYSALQSVASNFETVPSKVLRNKGEQLVIADNDYIPDREYADAEV